jgi:hypothetical protein
MFVKVEGTEFVKDTKTSALLMTGRNALAENEARKKLASRLKSKDDNINKIEDDVDGLKKDLLEIKMLLKQLVEIGS